MALALVWMWLGIGLLVLTEPALGGTFGVLPKRWLRGVSVGLLLLQVWPLAAEFSLGLAFVAALLTAMSGFSLAVLVAPLQPRLYVVTLIFALLVLIWLALAFGVAALR